MVGNGPGQAPPGMEPDVHHDIARDIGQQVEVMILEAKRQSESKVGKEIQKIKVKMEQMSEKIKVITERVSRLEPGSGGLLKKDLQQSIAKLEEVWEGEVGTLKHELWQTIQAHNHNADLLKHHKDAIDQVQARMSEVAPNPELEQVHAQLLQVDKVMHREVGKEQQMDQFMQRLTMLQQQVSAGAGLWAGGAAGSAYPMGQVAPAAAAGAANGKQKAKRQAAKPGKPKAASAASMQAAAAAASLRAEAPEFVPNTGGWAES
uniref:Uncharacterized protein n=1 Tax=Alexandrium monilatum TaxID=311494 RepID=A0A7S4VXL1_9DINO|mmetsp:Transcript_43141/g.128866  ORF Transcript_43141/g.128866 Transcript_43141/m.128866 type:complete len:262 (+) Transcript_43141:88-873(+)